MSNLRDARAKVTHITLNDGVEREIKFTLNAMAEMEDKYGSVDACFEEVEKGSIKAIRFVLWAGFSHADENLTEKQVGNLIDLQCMEQIMEAVNTAMGADMPEKKEDSQVVQLPNVQAPTV